MVRKVLATSIVVVAAVVACSTYGTDADEPGDAEAEAGALDAITDLGVALNEGGAGDGGDDGLPCPVGSPPGVFYSASFDVGNCEGWAVQAGTIEWVPTPNRCGAGACKVCANGSEVAVLTRDVPADKTDGTFELRFDALGDTYSGSIIAGLLAYTDGGVLTGTGQNQLSLTQSQWIPGQVIATNTSQAPNIAIRLYGHADAGGTCFYLDEIRLGHY